MTTLFEKASRAKLRFSTTRGDLTTEQLWDLPLQSKTGVSLDGIAVALHEQISTTSVSFVTAKTSANELIELAFEVVKHVIQVKKTEMAIKVQAQERASKAQVLKDLIEQKKGEALGQKTVEELEAELALIS